MNKQLFYGLSISLILVSASLILISGILGNPTQFLGVLIAVLIITSIVLAVEANLEFELFLVSLFAIAVASYVVGVIAVFIFGPGINPIRFENVGTAFVMGVRILSLVYPTTILIIVAIDRHEQSVREKNKKKAKDEKKEKL
jgi:hypothetical protein